MKENDRIKVTDIEYLFAFGRQTAIMDMENALIDYQDKHVTDLNLGVAIIQKEGLADKLDFYRRGTIIIASEGFDLSEVSKISHEFDGENLYIIIHDLGDPEQNDAEN